MIDSHYDIHTHVAMKHVIAVHKKRKQYENFKNSVNDDIMSDECVIILMRFLSLYLIDFLQHCIFSIESIQRPYKYIVNYNSCRTMNLVLEYIIYQISIFLTVLISNF